jgi:hypothetical protein
LGCRSSIRSAPLFHPTSLTLSFVSGITAPAESRTVPATPPLSFCPSATGGTATATSSTGRTNGNKFRPVLFMVHRLRMLSSQAFHSISFCLLHFRFRILKGKRLPIIRSFVNHFVYLRPFFSSEKRPVLPSKSSLSQKNQPLDCVVSEERFTWLVGSA